ncbi:MAG: hypothetical protein KKA65_01365 [Nanoarchaeota archaeon]|nr:hypothetical protein [Nanoarchaeota archaeon]MBU4241827.1 hypothetical protein [Nanoarchaeota archaeon]MBU4351924.1 hypothetical protein [Nanoarchaeota archaeon]MBU4456126.1 hypothetical protein [Nanoarchaeota archaeon]MCG2719252.1 hypothetical protein [Nanoarchaeota archaeon]
MKKQQYTKYYVSALIIACILVLSIVPLLRLDNSFSGTEAYLHLRMAENEGMFDELSYGGRFALYSLGLPSILSLNPDLLGYVLPLVLGVLSFLLFLGLLKEFNIETKSLAAIILILSPSFLGLFTTLNKLIIPIFLTLFGFYLIFRKSRLHLLAIPVFAIMPFFNIVISLMSLFLAFLLVNFKLKNKRWLFYILLPITIITTSLFLGYIFKNTTFERLMFEIGKSGINGKLQDIFSEMGGRYGLSIFASILAIFGMINNWKNKYKELFIFFSVFSLIILMMFRIEAIILLNFFIAVFAAKGFKAFLNARWESKNLRFFILLTFICGIVFASMAQGSRIVNSLPNEAINDALKFLDNLPDGTVFSHYSRGFWISYAGKSNVMDDNFMFAPNVNERWKDSQELFYTRDWKIAKGIIDKYNIKYVWIDNYLQEEIWEGDDEGLLFLLEYSNSLKKIYDNKDVYIEQAVQIWKVQEE